MDDPEHKARCLAGLHSFAAKAKAAESHKREDYRQAARERLLGKKQTPEFIAARAAGMLGHVVSEDAKKAISDAQRLFYSDPANREKVSKRRLGMKFTEEHRKNISLARKGVSTKGYPKSDEQRAKISASLKGRSRPPEAIAKHRATCAAKRFQVGAP